MFGETGTRRPRTTESLFATLPQNAFTAGHSQTIEKNLLQYIAVRWRTVAPSPKCVLGLVH